MRGDVLLVSADICLEEGNHPAFEIAVKAIEGLGGETRTKYDEAVLNLLNGRYYCATRKLGRAEETLAAAMQLFEGLEDKSHVGRVLYHLGECARAQGRMSVARDNLGKALGIFDAIEAKAWKEKTQSALTTLAS
jgi:tetratricopeptide (TPR) repeat protein